jgi:DNA-binding CsgD family transcriptional regulator
MVDRKNGRKGMGRPAIRGEKHEERLDDSASPQSGERRESTERLSWGSHLDSVVASYATYRGISAQQLVVLKLYLQGKSDKEIADICQCSTATVYEHWRRMAKKLLATLKSDVVADFHRFLAGT